MGDAPAPLRGWRTEEWKYVESIGGDDELYDLQHDPLETRNLVEDPTAAAARQRMRAALRDWLRQTDDPWPSVAQPPRIVPRRSPIYASWPIAPSSLTGLTFGGTSTP